MLNSMNALIYTLLFALLATSRADTQKISAPLFAWSSLSYFTSSGSDKDHHTHTLQVHTSLDDVLEQLLQTLTASKTKGTTYGVDSQLLHQQQPEVLLLTLGNQLRTSHLKSRVMHKPLEPLRNLLDQSASSLTVPYVLHEVAAPKDYLSKLKRLAADLQLAASVVGCGEGDAEALDAVLQQRHTAPHLVVLCINSHSQEALASPEEAVAAELQQLQAANDKVSALGKRHLTVYAAVPDAATSQPARRSLQGVQADVGTCGQLCQTQVKWLEGILAALLLAVAAFSGMCCLYMLDTPTRFEKPKEGSRND